MDGDDDQDGLENRLEYALGTSPVSDSQQRVPTAAFAGGYATLTFTRPGDITDISYNAQFSDELLAWTLPAEMVTTTTNGDGSITEVWRTTAPVSSQQRLFGRVQVTALPTAP